MDGPPTKRLRGLQQEVKFSFNDPFGDDEDFTQEDLDEIDIIASQAVTSSTGAPPPRGSALDKPLLPGKGKQVVLDREDSYFLLEAQHVELKKKLKEVEEEILLKSGEIRVLRDSLRTAQQEKDAQRQTHLLQEQASQREQSNMEKELNRKVQSLQSELQFKEAEVNELKTKLHSADRGSKTAWPRPTDSPKALSCVIQLHHGSGISSSSSAGNSFMTKESFNAQLPVKKTGKALREDRVWSSSKSTDRQKVSSQDPFLSIRLQCVQHRGGVLLASLLQQPLFPSSLGLSHLLSTSLTHIHSHSDSPGAAPGPALSPLQSLAVSGLSMLTQTQSGAARSCPGAVLLLPLLDLHLAQLCQCLDSSSSSPGHSPGSASSAAAGVEEMCLSGLSPWDGGLAALRVLNLLLTHSDEVVEAVLSESHSRVKHSQASAGVLPHSQHALLQHILQLCDSGICSSQRDDLVHCATKTLCVLLERTPHTHTHRLCCVLRSQVLCVSADSRWQCVSVCVCVFRSLCDHQLLVQQLCSQHDPCLLLKLFHYIRSRPDNQATHSDWTQLDLQVVRVLSRLTQRAESWTSNTHNCLCYMELVQTVVIILHRHWLDLRGSQDVSDSGQARPLAQSCSSSSRWCRGLGASLLRESLLLLHWLLLHHGSFSESCRPLLHMYDQVVPAVRETLRRIPDLTESEDLALDDLCRSEGDDMDMDSGS
ncbi:ATR-interacting protein isoform X2 [Genypterus blacodes]|uniref:ATR-interacting protein isoform X2 n=1 Tax=Genypterus blacodes TaxID=154954 RepID=UPI003F77368F